MTDEYLLLPHELQVGSSASLLGMACEGALKIGRHRILFNGRELTRVSSESDLVKFLSQVRAGFSPPHPILEFAHASGNRLYMGLSDKGNHLAYEDASRNPPYYSSGGQMSAVSGEEVIEYQMSEEGHVTEILRAHTVSFDDVLRVALAFLQTGVRPADVVRVVVVDVLSEPDIQFSPLGMWFFTVRTRVTYSANGSLEFEDFVDYYVLEENEWRFWFSADD